MYIYQIANVNLMTRWGKRGDSREKDRDRSRERERSRREKEDRSSRRRSSRSREREIKERQKERCLNLFNFPICFCEAYPLFILVEKHDHLDLCSFSTSYFAIEMT